MRAEVIAVALGMAVAGVPAGAVAQTATTRISTDIPPEPLRPALRSLAQEFGFQIVYPSTEVASRRSPGVIGSFTLSEALQHALAGTGLTFRYIDVHTITIVPLAGQTAADPPASGVAAGSDPKVGDPEALNAGGARQVPSTTFDGAAARAAADPPPARGGSDGSLATLHAIVVTGTRIRGVDTLNALPVQ